MLGFAIFRREQTENRVTISILIGQGLIPKSYFKQLAWGLVQVNSGELMGVGRTDNEGTFQITLPVGEAYRIRYVREPQNALDQEILRRVDDPRST